VDHQVSSQTMKDLQIITKFSFYYYPSRERRCNNNQTSFQNMNSQILIPPQILRLSMISDMGFVRAWVRHWKRAESILSPLINLRNSDPKFTSKLSHQMVVCSSQCKNAIKGPTCLQTDDDDDEQQPSPTRKLLKKRTNGTTDLAKVHSSFGRNRQNSLTESRFRCGSPYVLTGHFQICPIFAI
jgi:hypothetical protein